MIPEEIITNKIYLIRNEKVMLDRDLAKLYGVDTKIEIIPNKKLTGQS